MRTNITATKCLAALIAAYREPTPAFSFSWLADRYDLKSPTQLWRHYWRHLTAFTSGCVSFIGTGAGVGKEAFQQTDIISDRFQHNRAVHQRLRHLWGLKGEVDVCVPFVDPFYNVDFIEALRDEVGDRKVVTIESDVGCPQNGE